MSKQMVLSVMSKDRPGIVADITRALYSLDGDLADLRQSVLCGYFTMILMVRFPDDVSPDNVTEEISRIESGTELGLIVREIDDVDLSSRDAVSNDAIYVVTAQGTNREGLVARMGEFFRDRAINILDLDTALSDGLYSMMLQVDLSGVESPDETRHELMRLSEETGMTIVMQHRELFRAVHEISIS